VTRPRSTAPATAFASALLAEFVALGVRDVVLCPGSRSQALALAAAALEESGHIRLRVRIDERAAAFLALGIAIESRSPVLVVTTSGSAVANLHPAVLEAHHSAVPLIVLSADRPLELRGIGSNQTTHQPGIFGQAVRLSVDVTAPTGVEGEIEDARRLALEAVGAAQLGPVHLNLAFSEPLSSALVESALVEPAPLVELVETPPPLELSVGARTVVIAGAGAGQVAEETARALGAPLFAEVSSGAHFGPNLVVAYRELMTEPGFGDAIERVLVFGHPTLSREVPALVQRADVESIVMRTPGVEDYNPGHGVSTFAEAVTVAGEPHGREWPGRWVARSRAMLEQHDAPPIDIAVSDEPKDQAAFGRAVLASLRAPVTRRSLVEAVWRMTWPHDRLVLGASRLIREADRVVPGKKISVHANRGLAGIDGTIGTAMGIALASQHDGSGTAGVTRVLLGDLAALHDGGSLLFGQGEVQPRIQVIVGNDGGGTLFDSLEVAGTAPESTFDRVLLTPQLVSFEHLAAAYGWEYRHVANRGQLEEALAASERPTLVEVPLLR
jgi:2-succinyl-5-enolpyruvyl-6-hydroxy-3-cyclohexene-1-carboxylate synthase